MPIDPLSAQSIEVVRGAATLRYGSQAIGGVVNAINNRVPIDAADQAVRRRGERQLFLCRRHGAGLAAAGWRGRTVRLARRWLRPTLERLRHAGRQGSPIRFSRATAIRLAARTSSNDDKSHTGLAVIHYDASTAFPSDTTFIDMKQTKAISKSVLRPRRRPVPETQCRSRLRRLHAQRERSRRIDELSPSSTMSGTAAPKRCSGRSALSPRRRSACSMATASFRRSARAAILPVPDA